MHETGLHNNERIIHLCTVPTFCITTAINNLVPRPLTVFSVARRKTGQHFKKWEGPGDEAMFLLAMFKVREIYSSVTYI